MSNAIHAIGKMRQDAGVYEGNGISVKLSTIHPRYCSRPTRPRDERTVAQLKELFVLAKQYNIGLNMMPKKPTA